MDFIPDRESELVTWSGTYSSGLTALNTAVGITVLQASGYATLNSSWVTKYNATQNESTNTTTARIQKDEAKAELIKEARKLAGIVQMYPGTTNAHRAQLGLTVKDVTPTTIPVPGQCGVIIDEVNGRTVKGRVIDPANPTKRGRPAGVGLIAIYTHVGETYPDDLSEYDYRGSVGRTILLVNFATTVPAGSKIWVVAAYQNPRGEEGAPSVPAFAHLQVGAVESA